MGSVTSWVGVRWCRRVSLGERCCGGESRGGCKSFPRDGAVRAGAGDSAAAIVPFHLIVVAVSEIAAPKAQRGRSGLGLAR
jgi:hypothetical protein